MDILRGLGRPPDPEHVISSSVSVSIPTWWMIRNAHRTMDKLYSDKKNAFIL
jgi:hypothetical protein